MSLLLLFHGSRPAVVTAPWHWNGLLLPLHNPYMSGGAAPYIPNGLTLSATVRSNQTATVLILSGACATSAVVTGAKSTVPIDDGQREADIL